LAEVKKLEFFIVDENDAIKAGPYRFLLNPQEYSLSHPIRIRPTQTKGGVFIDDFGPGVGTMSIKGIVKNEFKEERDGAVTNLALQRFQELRDMVIKNIFEGRLPGTPPNRFLRVNNYTDRDFFITLPTNFSLQRSSGKPLFYYYNIDLIVLRRVGEIQEKRLGNLHGGIGSGLPITGMVNIGGPIK
jgi:transglutaminase-like putative cysteine protease